MDRFRIILLLRILLIAFLAVFLYTFISTPKMDCEACKFEIEGERYTMNEFFNLYSGECIILKRYLGFPMPNFSEIEVNVTE